MDRMKDGRCRRQSGHEQQGETRVGNAELEEAMSDKCCTSVEGMDGNGDHQLLIRDHET